MRYTKAIFILILCIPSLLSAQVPELQLSENRDGDRVTGELAVHTIEDTLEVTQAWNDLKKYGVPEELKFGFSTSFYWLGFTALNHSGSDMWVLEIENPHIDYVDVYVRSSGSNCWELIEQTGDKTPFYTRTLSHYNYAIPLEFHSSDTLDVAVMLDKIPTSMSYHSVLWSESEFSSYQQVQYGLNGLYFGMFGMVILAALIAFVFSRNLIYLWYLLFVLASGMYVFTDLGLAFQYLYPGSDTLNNYLRVYLAFGMTIFFILFTQEFFTTRHRLPLIHKCFHGTLAGLIILLIPAVFVPDLVSQVVNLFLPLLYLLILAVICLAIYTAVVMLRTHTSLAVFYLSAFIFIIAGGTVTILQEFGMITQVPMRFTPIQVATGIEVMILTGAMSWRIKKMYEDQIELTNKVSRLETKALRAHIDGIEQERSRIAMTLHDSIGNNLATLKRKIEDIAPSLTDSVSRIAEEVRSISHQLSPVGISLSGLERKVQQLITETDERSFVSYRFQCFDIPENLSESVKVEVYRIIQEAISNIEKHSRASEAEVQIMGHDDLLVITIEDNGVGLPESVYEVDGIGLHNMRQRVELLKGNIEVTSSKNRGVQLLIEIPVAAEFIASHKNT